MVAQALVDHVLSPPDLGLAGFALVKSAPQGQRLFGFLCLPSVSDDHFNALESFKPDGAD